MMRYWVRLTAIWLLCIFLAPTLASAHDLPLERMMNAFVKIEPRQIDLVIRVPLDLLRAVPFPLEQGGRYNLAASGPAVETALKALTSDLSVWENGMRLGPSSTVGHLAPLSDRSFEDYDQAIAGVAEPRHRTRKSRLSWVTWTLTLSTRSPRQNPCLRSNLESPET